MATATITLTDTDTEGGINVSVHYDPALDKGKTDSIAQLLVKAVAMAFYDGSIKKILPDIKTSPAEK
ncbi:MAG: hypothetical protein WC340_15620 [Kiritimatiellia bacterium]